MGAFNSSGVLPEGVQAALHLASLALTAAAMSASGLGVDLAAFRKVGREAVILGLAGFFILLGVMLPYALLAL